ALARRPGLGLFVGVDRQYAVGHGYARFERNAGNRARHFVADHFEVIGFAADDRAQRDQRVELEAFSHVRQRHAKLERAGHAGHHDVAFVHAEFGQLLQAGLEFGHADFFVEPGAHDTDVQPFAVQVGGKDVRIHESALGEVAEVEG